MRNFGPAIRRLVTRSEASPPDDRRSFDRASIARHFSFMLAAVGAWWMRKSLGIAPDVLWILGGAATLNFACLLLSWHALFRVLSPAFGLGGWAILIHLTDGVASPFIAGFVLEILLAARTFGVTGTVLVTGGAVLAVWGQEALQDRPLPVALAPLLTLTAMLGGVGLVTAALMRHWQRAQRVLSDEAHALRDRLGRLEETLDASGEGGAAALDSRRLGHGLKNTVHALHGFTNLIEEGMGQPGRERAALEGLRGAIQQLEEFSQLMLAPPKSRESAGPGRARIEPVVGEAIREAESAHPGVRWTSELGSGDLEVGVSPDVLGEILRELLRNAAHATGGRGRVAVEAAAGSDSVEIRVEDDGPGIPQDAVERLFDAGFTTKPEGNGLGLYLARKLLVEHGGELRAEGGDGRGARFRIQLPRVRAPIGPAAAEGISR